MQPPEFQSDVDLQEPGFLRGYVYDRTAPQKQWVVGLFYNGQLDSTCVANDTVEAWDTVQRKIGDCGFAFNLTRGNFNDHDRLELRILNTDHIILTFDLKGKTTWRAPMEDEPGGWVRHAKGSTLSGILDDNVTTDPSYEILAYHGDAIVGRTRVFRWQHVGDPKLVSGKRIGFELLIDNSLADGVLRRLHVETSTGRKLAGSPVDFLALPNAFREACRAVDGRKSSRYADMALDRILDNAVPFSAYDALFPQVQTPTSETVLNGYCVFAQDGVTPLAAVADLLEGAQAPLVYFDLAVETQDGTYPLLLPAFDYERHLEQGYASLMFAARMDIAEAAQAAGARTAQDIFCHAMAHISADEIAHCPAPGGRVHEEALGPAHARQHAATLQAYLGREDSPASADTDRAPDTGTRFPAVRVRRTVTDTRVSVIIPTKDQGKLLEQAITSLTAQNPEFDLDILVVDNGSTEPATEDVFARLEDRGVRILEFDAGFNFALINTLAVEYAKHEQLCFLNNDVYFPEPGVLTELCSRLNGPMAGAVGPLMVRSTDIIQHGGVVLGPHNGATHAFEDRMRHDAGYGEMLRVAHECSAVTGAMLLTRKSLFEQLGGFDERLFPVNFNDVDYCLRLREAGHRVIFTPHACIQHFESVSRGRENRSPSVNRMLREVQNLRERWGGVIRNDPFFHPQFSRDTLPYRALTSRAVAPDLRTRTLTRSATIPAWT